jgi:multidrug transporter EmrE-like cation transporter
VTYLVGVLFYKDTLGLKQIIGIVLCMGRKVLINR